MSKRKKFALQNVVVERYAAEGKCIAKIDEKVVFITGAVPGDIVDIFITKNKKDYAEAHVTKLIEGSSERVTPFCNHFEVCGGCKWQMLPYEHQLKYKEQQVKDVIQRIGKVEQTEWLPIIGCAQQSLYRNKLEFTFSNKRYLTTAELNQEQIVNVQNVLGYHAPKLFDKVIDIEECHLMVEPQNKIRNAIRQFAYENNFSFYDLKAHKGFLRTLMLRTTTLNQTLLNIVFGENNEAAIAKTMEFIVTTFPEITSVNYTINTKLNDTLYDQDIISYKTQNFIQEKLEDFLFKISPKSFFQTNTKQAEILYNVAREFAGLTGKETLYDLYCGTGSIGIFCSKQAGKIIGVEAIADAIVDAKQNALDNKLENTHWFAGDVINICTEDFFKEHGAPDVVITDPPRVGMHQKLIDKLLAIKAPKIVYVSCNPATQARDLLLLQNCYEVTKMQAVDMFPQTHHVESVALLTLKK